MVNWWTEEATVDETCNEESEERTSSFCSYGVVVFQIWLWLSAAVQEESFQSSGVLLFYRDNDENYENNHWNNDTDCNDAAVTQVVFVINVFSGI